MPLNSSYEGSECVGWRGGPCLPAPTWLATCAGGVPLRLTLVTSSPRRKADGRYWACLPRGRQCSLPTSLLQSVARRRGVYLYPSRLANIQRRAVRGAACLLLVPTAAHRFLRDGAAHEPRASKHHQFLHGRCSAFCCHLW